MFTSHVNKQNTPQNKKSTTEQDEGMISKV